MFEHKKQCFGCEACAAACPAGAVSMRRDAEGFAYPVVSESLCTDCGACEEVCPAKQSLSRAPVKAFAVRCTDASLLYQSTSGGAFSLLADAVIAEGGAVCGACFDDAFMVVHRVSSDFAPMRKSKYVQSSLGECYEEMKQVLRSGRRVLFTGTPCQCHAVRLLFGKADGLLIASLVCRGVMSPGFWERYVGWLSQGGGLTSYCFRDKRRNDDAHTVSYTVGGEETVRSFLSDPLTRIYAKCLAFRESCYACPYCVTDKDFDFTIGDFWGVEKVIPDLADGRGTSLVLAGSEEALRMIDRIAENAFVSEVSAEAAMQEALHKPAATNPMLRKLFARDALNPACGMDMVLKKYGC